MIRVNGKELAIYSLDTKESLVNRIASEMETLPKYLYFPQELELTKGTKIEVEDLLKEIKENAQISTNFEEFLAGLQDKLSKEINVKTDVLYVWLAYNKTLADTEGYGLSFLVQAVQPLIGKTTYFQSEAEFQTFWRQRNSVIRTLERQIKNHEILVKRDVELSKAFEAIDEDDAWGFTEYVTTKITLKMVLDLKEISLLEIFNAVVLSEAVPFANCGNYYKILKDYIPPEEWAGTSEGMLKLKISDKQQVSTQRVKDYNDVILTLEGDIGQEIVSASVILTTEKGYLSQEQFVDRFLQAFTAKSRPKLKDISETRVFGNFYFPQKRFNTYVFSDLVMNNHVFAKLINIDESVKLTKKKAEGGSAWLHIHFEHPSTGDVSASLLQKTVDRGEAVMRSQDEDIFPHGSPYIRVHAKGRDMKAIMFFQTMLAKLFAMYEQNYEDIVHEYEVFLPDFGEIQEIVAPARKKILDTALFTRNYTRYCPEDRMPTILKAEDVAEFEEKGLQVMKFPRDKPENGQVYPSDGVKQQFYVCLNPEYSFPGIQVNKLDNAENYPYVPCCFKIDQNKEGGVYRHYFFGEEKKAKDKKQQELIVTDKFLEADQFGKLPENLQRLFSTLDSASNYTYIRIGVGSTFSSFLHAIMVGLHEKTNLLGLSPAKQEEKVRQTRMELGSEHIAPMARQSVYDMSIQSVIKLIKNDQAYFDPRLFTQLLEGYFNCNIFLFNRDQMFLPRHLQGYYRDHSLTETKAECVFIYEHMGSESDRALYPRCELICRWNKKQSTDTQYFFPYDQTIARNISRVFRLMNEAYVLGTKISEVVFPIKASLKMMSQKLDSYGKTRCVNFSYGGGVVSVVTSPMPPLALPETTDPVVLCDVATALALFEEMGVQITSQTVSNQLVKELNGVIGNVNVTVAVNEQAILEDIPSSNLGMHYSGGETQSVLEQYNRNNKTARYLVEYIFWMFSRYLAEKKVDLIDDQVLARFASKKIQIIPDHDYGQIPKLFSDNGSVVHGGKLVVLSEEMQKRLMYVLKLATIRNLKTLRGYAKHTSITHYYVDITDFDIYPNQTILQGEDAVDKWIQESKFVNVLHNDIIVGSNMPYFFKNPLVEDRIFLAQNTPTLERAMKIAITWQRSGYNPRNLVDDAKNQLSFMLYAYKSPDDITKIHVNANKEPRQEIRLLGYKLSGTPFYTVLLDLE